MSNFASRILPYLALAGLGVWFGIENAAGPGAGMLVMLVIIFLIFACPFIHRWYFKRLKLHRTRGEVFAFLLTVFTTLVIFGSLVLIGLFNFA